MQHVTKDSVCQDFVGKRPLPLGEGWGEGLATKPKILFSPFLSERRGKRMKESFLFLFTQLRPHPGPLPKGEGVTYKFLAHWLIRNHWLLQSDRRMFSRL